VIDRLQSGRFLRHRRIQAATYNWRQALDRRAYSPAKLARLAALKSAVPGQRVPADAEHLAVVTPRIRGGNRGIARLEDIGLRRQLPRRTPATSVSA